MISRARAELEACAAAAEVFKALSAPARLLILRRLADQPACVHELVDELDLSQPLVSQHLRVLRQVHLVRGTRRGRETAYELADQHVAHIVADAIAHISETGRTHADPPDPTDDPIKEHSP